MPVPTANSSHSSFTPIPVDDPNLQTNTAAPQSSPAATARQSAPVPGLGQGATIEQELRSLSLASPVSPLLNRTVDALFISAKGENPEQQEKFRTFLTGILPTMELQNLFAKFVLLKLTSEVKGKGVGYLTEALSDSLSLSPVGSAGVSLHALVEGLSRTLINQSANYGVESMNNDLANSAMKELVLKPFAEFGQAMEINPYFRVKDKRIDSRGINMTIYSSAAVLLAPAAREAKRVFRASDMARYAAVSAALGSQLIQFFSRDTTQKAVGNETGTEPQTDSSSSGLVTALAMNIALKAVGHLWEKYAASYRKNSSEKTNFSEDITGNPGSFFGISQSGKQYWLSRWETEELSQKDDNRYLIFYQAKEALEAVADFHPDYGKLNEMVRGIKSMLVPDKDVSDRMKSPAHQSMVQYLALLQEFKHYKENPSVRIMNDLNAEGIEFRDVCIIVDVNRPNTPVDPASGRFTTSLVDIVNEVASGREKHSFTFPKEGSTLCVGTNNLGKSLLRRFMTGGYAMGKGQVVFPTKEDNGDKFANVRVFTHEPFFGPGVTLKENILINSGSSEQDRGDDIAALDYFNKTMTPQIGNEGFGKVLDREDGHCDLSLGTQQIASIAAAYVSAARAARKNEHIVLILDEACNGLNMGPSDALQKLFEPLKKNVTSFQIAHSNENLIIKPDHLFELAKITLVEQEKNPLTPKELEQREKSMAIEIKKRGLTHLPKIPIKVSVSQQEREKLLEEQRGIMPPRRSERIKR